MNVEEIRSHLEEAPFRPFVLKLSNGEAYRVDHPDLINMTRNTVYLFVDVAEDGVAERVIRLGALHIAALEPLRAERTEESNQEAV